VGVWDPTIGRDGEYLEMMHHNAVRFIAGLTGWESITEAPGL